MTRISKRIRAMGYKPCAGCARRRAKIKAALVAAKQGVETARASYLRQVGKAPPRKGGVTQVVRVR